MLRSATALAIISVFAAWHVYFKRRKGGNLNLAIAITIIQAFFISLFGRYTT